MASDHDTNNNGGDVGGSERLVPTKDTLTALKSDVTRESAIKELIDNALDAHERNSERLEPATIKVFGEDEGDHTELVIWDDTGGVPREEAKMVFTLGMTAKDQGGLIGTFGLGAKKALVNLGVPFTIASHHEDEDVGWQYTIDREWLEDDDNWTVDIEPREDLEPGVTEIRIHDLAYNWFQPDEETEDDDVEPVVPYEELRDELARTYNWFLSNELYGHDFDITIEVQGEAVQPVGLPDWSYTPFDGMHPRRYEDIKIDLEDLDEVPETTLHITVGLLRKQDSDAAGIDIYCQHRQVIEAARDERVGVGTRGGLGNWTQHNNRLKVIVELETDGDAKHLPWDTQKANVDRHNPIMRETRDWLKRAVKDYFKLDTSTVPRAFLEYYPPNSAFAANEGDIQVEDYSNRSRVMHRPDTDLPQLTELVQTVEAHAKLNFRCERGLEDWQVPAYKAHLNTEAGVDSYEDLPELTMEPVDLDESRVDEYVRKLEQLARSHWEAEIKYTGGLTHWQIPKYEAYIENEAMHRGIELEEVDEVPEGVPAGIDDLGDSSEAESRSDEGPSALLDDDSGTAVEEDLVVVRVDVPEDDVVYEADLLAEDRTELVEALGLDEDATRDDIAVELGRRLQLAIEMGAATA